VNCSINIANSGSTVKNRGFRALQVP
jgi:hypothetical protein